MKSLIQIVDTQDKLIGHQERSKVNYQDVIYRVSSLWLTNSRGDVLLAQRKLTKDKDPGKWGPAVAGTLDEGETYESNVYKEAGEEIGLSGVRFSLGPKTHITEPRNYFCQWFLATIDRAVNEFVLQEEEVEQVAWVGANELFMDHSQDPEKYVPAFGKVLTMLLGKDGV